jgi:hypothetical protein
METNPDLRGNTRFNYDAPIMFEHYPTGQYYEGRMLNYSRGGLYFESNYAPTVGTEIFIGLESSPYSSSHDVYRAKVIWHKELPDANSFFFHGIGVKYS